MPNSSEVVELINRIGAAKRKAVEALEAAIDEIERQIANTGEGPARDKLLDQARALSAKVGEITEAANDEILRLPEVARAVGRLESAADEMKAVADEMRAVTDKIANGAKVLGLGTEFVEIFAQAG